MKNQNVLPFGTKEVVLIHHINELGLMREINVLASNTWCFNQMYISIFIESPGEHTSFSFCLQIIMTSKIGPIHSLFISLSILMSYAWGSLVSWSNPNDYFVYLTLSFYLGCTLIILFRYPYVVHGQCVHFHCWWECCLRRVQFSGPHWHNSWTPEGASPKSQVIP